MSLSSQPFETISLPLRHLDGEICPMCEQTIPNERLEQVKARKDQHQREVESQFALRSKRERDELVAQLRQQNDEDLARARQESAEKEATARAEGRQAVIVEVEAKIASAINDANTLRTQANDLQRQLQANNAATEEKVIAARDGARKEAEAALRPQLDAAQSATEEARARVRVLSEREEETQAQITQLSLDVTAAREEGRQVAETELNARTDELNRQLQDTLASTDEKINAAQDSARQEANSALEPLLAAARAAAQQALLEAQLSADREESARTQVEQLIQDVEVAREEGRSTAAAELQTALAAQASAEKEAQAMREDQDRVLRAAIAETREALEKSHRDAINAEQSKHFDEKQKFQNTVEELKRQLENKTASELGEGAEIDLFEALKGAFPDDDIVRIKKGVAGADIRHVVRHNSKECGRILYDSKNHKAWRNDFVTKLRDDQIADKADHAILSTIAFPQGIRQLHVQDGVILVNPARAVVIAEMVRRQVLQAHTLNLSNDDRGKKSLELYSFIMSERFLVLMTKVRATTDSLSKLDIKEQDAHKAVWRQRALLVGSVAKAEADVRSEIDRIVGTADAASEDDLAGFLADTTGAGA